MKKVVMCELCESPAKMYCESDRARLCYHCDAKVHSANFLVAKHSRTLLCHHCQNTTPWTASGQALPPSLSLCLSCASRPSSHRDRLANTENNIGDSTSGGSDSSNDFEDDTDSDVNDDDDDSEMEENDEEEDDNDDNQVVPWKPSLSSDHLDCTSTTSGSESEDDEQCHGDINTRGASFSTLKRKRGVAYLHTSSDFDGPIRL